MVRIQPQAPALYFYSTQPETGGNRETERKGGGEMQRKKEISKEKIKGGELWTSASYFHQPPIRPLLLLALLMTLLSPPFLMIKEFSVRQDGKNSKCSQTHYS